MRRRTNRVSKDGPRKRKGKRARPKTSSAAMSTLDIFHQSTINASSQGRIIHHIKDDDISVWKSTPFFPPLDFSSVDFNDPKMTTSTSASVAPPKRTKPLDIPLPPALNELVGKYKITLLLPFSDQTTQQLLTGRPLLLFRVVQIAAGVVHELHAHFRLPLAAGAEHQCGARAQLASQVARRATRGASELPANHHRSSPQQAPFRGQSPLPFH